MKQKLFAILAVASLCFFSCEQEEDLLSQNFSLTQVFDMDTVSQIQLLLEKVMMPIQVDGLAEQIRP